MEEGSILGPLLYSLGQICISVILDIIKEEMDQNFQKKIDTLSCKYADDVTGYFAVDSDGMAKQNQNSWVSSWIQGSSYWIMLIIISCQSAVIKCCLSGKLSTGSQTTT